MCIACVHAFIQTVALFLVLHKVCTNVCARVVCSCMYGVCIHLRTGSVYVCKCTFNICMFVDMLYVCVCVSMCSMYYITNIIYSMYVNIYIYIHVYTV